MLKGVYVVCFRLDMLIPNISYRCNLRLYRRCGCSVTSPRSKAVKPAGVEATQAAQLASRRSLLTRLIKQLWRVRWSYWRPVWITLISRRDTTSYRATPTQYGPDVLTPQLFLCLLPVHATLPARVFFWAGCKPRIECDGKKLKRRISSSGLNWTHWNLESSSRL
jgi:hypothetical protein